MMHKIEVRTTEGKLLGHFAISDLHGKHLRLPQASPSGVPIMRSYTLAYNLRSEQYNIHVDPADPILSHAAFTALPEPS